MPKRSDSLLLEDIFENAEFIFDSVKDNSYDSLINDKMKLYAVIRAFEIVGEAAGAVSEATKQKHSEIEWREMSDFRNILIHQYFGVEYKIPWSVIQNDLPFNYQLLQKIIL